MIVGIDPGTTVGWAMVNFSGELIAIGSEKEFNRDKLIAELVTHGRTLVIGSDKAKLPSFVQETAAKLGARVFFPHQDLRVEEKRDMTRGYVFDGMHQMDALAGALLAYRKLQPLLIKIRAFLQREGKLPLFVRVAELVIKERISIRAALVLLEPPTVAEEHTDELPLERDEDIARLYSSMVRLRKDNTAIRKQNQLLEQRLRQLDDSLASLRQKTATLVKPKTRSEEARLKQQQVISFSQRLENTKKREQELAQLVLKLEQHLLNEDSVALIRLRSLSWEEVNKAKEFLGEDAIFFVDDIHAMSTQALTWFKTRNVGFAVSAMQVGENARRALPFSCITTREYELFPRVAIVKRSLLEKFKSERSVLSKVVDEYKKRQK
ncbi:DUF460 domain-containing protein [Candidatus Woesearchaeota archaeon]|nr:DUF460 domain-containing protein [Candidatus Woesearchaeota archaeon]